jgi:hypothetical protein
MRVKKGGQGEKKSPPPGNSAPSVANSVVDLTGTCRRDQSGLSDEESIGDEDDDPDICDWRWPSSCTAHETDEFLYGSRRGLPLELGSKSYAVVHHV